MANERGPFYDIELLDSLPLNNGGMRQALPGRAELQEVAKRHPRVVAGYETLLAAYRRDSAEAARLRNLREYLEDPEVLLQIPQPHRLFVSRLLHGADRHGDEAATG